MFVAAAFVGVAIFILFLGPQTTITCTQASWPNSLLGDQLGHVDGVDFTGCVVPTRESWVGIAALLITATLLLLTVRSTRGTA